MFCLRCFCPLPSLASLPCPLLSLSLSLALSLSPPLLSLPPSHTRCTSTCNITCTCACMHTHTPLACHLVGSLISSSLVVSAPSFSAFNSPSYPPFLALSIVDHDLTRQNLASSLFLPECKYWNVINLFDFYQVTLLWRPKAKH